MRCKKRVLSPGEVLIREGEKGNSILFFLEGKVVISHAVILKRAGEVEKSFRTLEAKEGTLFGEVSVVDESLPRSATITAKSRCVFYELSKEDFEDFCQKNYRGGYFLMRNLSRILARRFYQATRDILKLTTALSIALEYQS